MLLEPYFVHTHTHTYIHTLHGFVQPHTHTHSSRPPCCIGSSSSSSSPRRPRNMSRPCPPPHKPEPPTWVPPLPTLSPQSLMCTLKLCVHLTHASRLTLTTSCGPCTSQVCVCVCVRVLRHVRAWVYVFVYFPDLCVKACVGEWGGLWVCVSCVPRL